MSGFNKKPKAMPDKESDEPIPIPGVQIPEPGNKK